MTRAVIPAFPADSFNKGHFGVAVIGITVNPDGSVGETELLETPDAAIGEEVERSVSQWQFLPAASSQPVRLRSRLIFYFRSTYGQPIVIDAASEYLKAHSISREKKQ